MILRNRDLKLTNKVKPGESSDNKQYQMRIHSYPDRYEIAIVDPNSHKSMYVEAVSVSTLAKSPLVGGAFTGMMFGLYALGRTNRV